MPTTTRIIDLAEPGAGDRLPAFAAVHGIAPENAFVLSPEVMHWHGPIFLCRLDRCRQFWLAQKKKRRASFGTLFDPLLRQHCGADYTAVFGDHPWPCLLLLHFQLAHGARGLHWMSGRLNRSIFRALDWDAWFEPQAALAKRLESAGARGFDAERFRARQAQLRRFIERAAIAAPRELRAADGHAIARRFGRWLGRVWRWSFSARAGLDGFPWQSFAPSPPPAVRRDLDYPVNDWDTTAALLREDCARLCAGLARDDGLHVNRMGWRITLYNQEYVDVELSFRHPYSLHRDAPAFATALYQARYVYDDVIRRLAGRATDLDLPEQIPFVAWRLEISERLSLTPQWLDLFADDRGAVDFARVMQLQNKLPRELECYQGRASFLAEDAYRRAPIGAPRDTPLALGAWAGSAANKPLFCYPEPQAIEPAPGRAVFVERSASPWWLVGDADCALRDYFILRDARGRATWVYRDAGGSWYRQGEFC